MINTVWGSTDKPVSSKRLIEHLRAEEATQKVSVGQSTFACESPMVI